MGDHLESRTHVAQISVSLVAYRLSILLKRRTPLNRQLNHHSLSKCCCYLFSSALTMYTTGCKQTDCNWKSTRRSSFGVGPLLHVVSLSYRDLHLESRLMPSFRLLWFATSESTLIPTSACSLTSSRLSLGVLLFYVSCVVSSGQFQKQGHTYTLGLGYGTLLQSMCWAYNKCNWWQWSRSVSYTHLTLPTIYSV